MLAEMRVQGRRKRGRPRKRCYDTVQDDMRRWRLEEEDTENRDIWHALIELGALQDRYSSRTVAD